MGNGNDTHSPRTPFPDSSILFRGPDTDRTKRVKYHSTRDLVRGSLAIKDWKLSGLSFPNIV